MSRQVMTQVQEDREIQVEADRFQDTWLIEKAELSHDVLSNLSYDWKDESLRIECQIEETLLSMAPLVMEAAANPVVLRPTKAQAERAKILRRQYNIIILMELRRQLIMELIGEIPA